VLGPLLPVRLLSSSRWILQQLTCQLSKHGFEDAAHLESTIVEDEELLLGGGSGTDLERGPDGIPQAYDYEPTLEIGTYQAPVQELEPATLHSTTNRTGGTEENTPSTPSLTRPRSEGN
jgi:hypothetical protein